MSYQVLDPSYPIPALAHLCALVVMAKAPRPGRVKTRLSPPLTLEQTAALNVRFLRDTCENLGSIVGGAGLISYTPVGDEALFDGLLPETFALVPQRGDGFGERLLAAAEDVLAIGYGAVCLIDSDSPTVPTAAFAQAVEALRPEGDRVVIGPSHDGGYYLIGMKRAHAEPFQRITWSTGSVFAETIERCGEAGLAVVTLPTWYDVDDAATLAVLNAELLQGRAPAFAAEGVCGYAAPHTRELLEAMQADPAAVRAGVNDFIERCRPWRAFRPWQTNTALVLIGVAMIGFMRQFIVESDHYMIGFSGCSSSLFVLYLGALTVFLLKPANVDRSTFWIILGFAIVCRLVALFPEPFLSSDVYRYAWDGVVQHAGINPYRYVPGNAALTFLREPNQELFDHMNRRDYAHTIYPPVAQMCFYLITWISGTVTFMKMTMVLFEGLVMVGLVKLLAHLGRPREWTLLYAWCPLCLWEFAGSGHLDAMVMAFLVFALLFRYRRQPVLTGLFLGFAVFTKFYPLVLFPALYRRGDWKMPATLATVGVLCYVPYLSVGQMVFGFMGGYVEEEGMSTGARYFLLDLVQHVPGLHGVPNEAFLGFAVLVFGALMVWAWRMGCRDESAPGAFLPPAFALGLALMLLFSPHYPWYIAWLIPFFVLLPNLTVLTYIGGLFYMCTTALAVGYGPQQYQLNEILYSALLCALVVELVLRRLPWTREWMRGLAPALVYSEVGS